MIVPGAIQYHVSTLEDESRLPVVHPSEKIGISMCKLTAGGW